MILDHIALNIAHSLSRLKLEFPGFCDPQHDEDVRKAFEDFMAKYKKFPGVDHLFMSHMFFELVWFPLGGAKKTYDDYEHALSKAQCGVW